MALGQNDQDGGVEGDPRRPLAESSELLLSTGSPCVLYEVLPSLTPSGEQAVTATRDSVVRTAGPGEKTYLLQLSSFFFCCKKFEFAVL